MLKGDSHLAAATRLGSLYGCRPNANASKSPGTSKLGLERVDMVLQVRPRLTRVQRQRQQRPWVSGFAREGSVSETTVCAPRCLTLASSSTIQFVHVRLRCRDRLPLRPIHIRRPPSNHESRLLN